MQYNCQNGNSFNTVPLANPRPRNISQGVKEISHQDILSPELYECKENPKEGIANPCLNTILHNKTSRTLQHPNKQALTPNPKYKPPCPKKGIPRIDK